MLLIPLLLSHPDYAVEIKAVGDVMPGSITPRRIVPPDSGKVFVRSIGSYLSDADVVMGNLEGVFVVEGKHRPIKCSERSRRAGRCYEFGIPWYVAPSLRDMGFTVLTMDNNHVMDYGLSAYRFTERLLDSIGITPVPRRRIGVFRKYIVFPEVDGCFRNAPPVEVLRMGDSICALERPDVKNRRWEKDISIAIVPFGFSGSSWRISDLDVVDSLIPLLDSLYDIVIVSFHGGAEGRKALHVRDEVEFFYGENRGNVVKFARRAVDRGADLVVGHGPHVLRAMQIYKGRLIAYSLGNFLTYGNVNIRGVNGISAILHVRLAPDGRFVDGKIIPVIQKYPGIPVYDGEKRAIGLIKRLVEEDGFSDSLLISDDGSIEIPGK